MKLVATVVFLLATLVGADDVLAYLPSATPESCGVSSAAIVRWLEACDREIDSVHAFVLVRHGRVIAEGCWSPFQMETPHALFSHSKSFTSTAVGLLVDDGRLSLDERMADILPDKMPATPSANLNALTVRDLLTMRAGHDHDIVYDAIRPGEDDWVRTFLASDFPLKPGTTFAYDTCATHVLAAIVSRRAGEDLMSFLRRRLFAPLGIADAWSWRSPDGTAIGGYGMNMTCRDLALFGQLYLQKGVWDGRRILSEKWIGEATAAWAKNGPHPNPDWGAGYGYQFWRCKPEGVYRADGALGQFTVVMTKEDAVLSLLSGAEETQRELSLVWEHLLPAFGDRPLPEDPKAREALRRKIAALALPGPKGVAAEGPSELLGRRFALEPNPFGAAWIELDRAGVGCELVWGNACGVQRAPVGVGCWKRGGKVRVQPGEIHHLRDIPGEHPVAGCGGRTKGGAFAFDLRFTDGPSGLRGTLALSEDRLAFGGTFRAKNEMPFSVRGYPVPRDRSLRFVQWNIGHFAGGDGYLTRIAADDAEAKLREWRAFLAGIDADILGLSEYSCHFSRAGHNTRHDLFGDWRNFVTGPEFGYQCNALAVRGLSCGDARIHQYGTFRQRTYYLAEDVDVNGLTVTVVQTHLDTSDRRAADPAAARRAQIEELVAAFAETPRVIVSGDFNVDSQAEYEPFARAGFAMVNAVELPTHPKRRPPLTAAIDNVFVRGFRVSDVHTLDGECRFSDHCPLVCRLTAETDLPAGEGTSKEKAK